MKLKGGQSKGEHGGVKGVEGEGGRPAGTVGVTGRAVATARKPKEGSSTT